MVEYEKEGIQLLDLPTARELGPGTLEGEGDENRSDNVRAAISPSSPAKALSPRILPTGPEPVVFEFRYLKTSELPALAEPRKIVEGLATKLASPAWLTACDGLNELRRLAAHHSNEPIQEDLLLSWALLVSKSVKSPRSALCKTALMCLTDLFASLGDAMLPALSIGSPSLLLLLLQKSAQDKKFVAEEAHRALTTMASTICPSPMLQLLYPCLQSKNCKIRAVACQHTADVAARMDDSSILDFGLALLLKDAGTLLTDKLPEARASAKKLVQQLYAVFDSMPICDSSEEEGKAEEGNEEEEEEEEVKEVYSNDSDRWETFCIKHLEATRAITVSRIR